MHEFLLMNIYICMDVLAHTGTPSELFMHLVKWVQKTNSVQSCF